MMLRKRRMAHGALELNMPEVKVELDKQGRVAGAHVVENTESHQIIEEFMLAANEAVAEAIRDRGLHFLRRVHQSPSPQKLQALTEFVAELGYKTGSLQSRFELQKLLAAAIGRPEQHAVHFAVLRSMQRAIYSPMEEGHYALASECYCHFTSPIRRYPDLTIHRLVDAMLTKTKPRNDYDELVVLGPALLRPRAAGRGRRTRADQTQAAGLSERPHRRGDGRRRDGRRELRPFRPRGQAAGRRAGPRRNAPRRHYRFDRASHTLAGHRAGNSYRLGDLLRVAVARVDLERREIDFRVVERGKQKSRRPQRARRAQRKQRRWRCRRRGKRKRRGARKKRGK